MNLLLGKPELVLRVEKDLLKIMARGTVAEQEGDENARGGSKKPAAPPVAKDDVPETSDKCWGA